MAEQEFSYIEALTALVRFQRRERARERGEITMTTTDPSELGRALAARRSRATVVCEACRQAFEARISEKRPPRTCANACRQKLWRREKKVRIASHSGAV